MEKELQQKAIEARIECKAEGEDGKLHISFYACAFGNIDSYRDIIDSKACDAFLTSEDAKRMKLCYQHDLQEVIGVVTDMKADAIGLLCEADILPTQKGKDVQTLIKAGAINEFSIGYFADEYHYERRGEDELRILDAITIIEASPVTRAANPKAILLDAKSEDFQAGLKELTDEQLEEMKAAIEYERLARLIKDI